MDPQPICQCPEPLVVQEEDQLIEIANDGGRKSVFEQTSLAGFSDQNRSGLSRDIRKSADNVASISHHVPMRGRVFRNDCN